MALKTDIEQLDGGRKLPLVEDFYTIQGEGFHAGKPAYFIRLGGCDVGCRWCDAKYTWNPRLYPPTDVRTVIDRATACPAQAIVITGGEPLLYPLGVLTETLHAKGLEIFLETSGTHPFSGYFDWVCLSPKRQQPPLDEAFRRAHELKVIVERIEQRFAARDDDRTGRAGQRTVDDHLHVDGRVTAGIPRIFGVAPATAHVASAQTNEIGGFARVEAFALNGVEVLHERQSAAAVEQCGIGVNHSLRRKYF